MLSQLRNPAWSLNILPALVLMVSSAYVASGQPVVTDSSSSESISVVKKFAPKFRQRLHDIQDQIDAGVTKGWITQEQANQLKQEHDRVSAFEVEVRKKGYPRSEEDQLEKRVTELNLSLQSAIAKTSAPKPTQASQGAPETKPGTATDRGEVNKSEKEKPAQKAE